MPANSQTNDYKSQGAKKASITFNGKEYPALLVPETLSEITERLLKRYEHLDDLPKALLSQLKVGKPLVFRPTIIDGYERTVGYLLKDIAEEFGIEHKSVQCNAVAREIWSFTTPLFGMDRSIRSAKQSLFSEAFEARGSASFILHFDEANKLQPNIDMLEVILRIALRIIRPFAPSEFYDQFYDTVIDPRFVSPILTWDSSRKPIPSEFDGCFDVISVADRWGRDSDAYDSWELTRYEERLACGHIIPSDSPLRIFDDMPEVSAHSVLTPPLSSPSSNSGDAIMSDDTKVAPLKSLNANQAAITTSVLITEGGEWHETVAFIAALDEGLALKEADAIDLWSQLKAKIAGGLQASNLPVPHDFLS